MVKLHLGCGKRDFGPMWDHIDQVDMPHIKSHDVTKLPYESNSVDVIYACHLIAYFDRVEIIPILQEWKRVLRPGGVLRLATPDFREMAYMYVRQNGSDLSQFLGPLYGKMGSPVIYHKTVYDFYSLIELLASVGFKSIRKYNHHNTEHHMVDDHSAAYIDGRLISLNVQCIA